MFLRMLRVGAESKQASICQCWIKRPFKLSSSQLFTDRYFTLWPMVAYTLACSWHEICWWYHWQVRPLVILL